MSFYSALISHRYLKSIPKWDQDLHILHSQYHGCWCHGDIRSQGISSHDIDLVELVKGYQKITSVKGDHRVRLWALVWFRMSSEGRRFCISLKSVIGKIGAKAEIICCLWRFFWYLSAVWYIETWTKWPPICKLHFQMHFLEKACVLIKISLKFIPKCLIDNKLAFLGGNGLALNRPLPHAWYVL